MSVFGDLTSRGQLPKPPEEYLHPDQHTTGDSIEVAPIGKPLELFLSVFIFVFLLLGLRLFNLQIIQGSKYLTLADGNRIRVKTIPSPRGIIIDRYGQALVKNVAGYDLVIIPANLPRKKEDRQAVYQSLKDRYSEDATTIVEKIESHHLISLDPITVKSNLSIEEAFSDQIYFKDSPGLEVITNPIRSYPYSLEVSHLLGSIGKISPVELNQLSGYQISDWIGKTGLEKNYESFLKGSDGQEQVEIDAKGRLQRIVGISDAVQGNNLKTNIDLKLQLTAYQALEKSAKENGVGKGAAMAMNPKTGQIYALVSLPSFDLNKFIQADQKNISAILNDQNQPLINRAISGTYPSGSSIKPVYASAGLQEKVVSPSFAVDTPPEIRIGDFVFPDWKDHGLTDIRRAIAESNNIFFYAIGGGWDKIKGLGIKRIDEYLKKFGYGTTTGIDLPSEAKGFVPDPDWKKNKKKEPWYIGDTYHLSIGQGDLTVTPMQMQVALSAIINGGKLVTPHLAQEIVDVEGKTIKTIDPVIKKENLIDKSNLNVVQEGMRQAVEAGSARSLNNLVGENGQPIKVAGKTGTAQSGHGNSTHAWFIGYAPYDDPQIIVTVLVEDAGEGYASAAPVAKEMLKTFFREPAKDQRN